MNFRFSPTANIIRVFYSFLFMIFFFPGPVPARQSPQLRLPLRLALMPGTRVLVSDPGARKILVVSTRNGKVIRSFPVSGKPLGVAYSKGKIYVGNHTRGCIEVYNLGGKKRYDIGQPGKQKGSGWKNRAGRIPACYIFHQTKDHWIAQALDSSG